MKNKVYYVGFCKNGKSGHPYTISVNSEEECMHRMQSYCDFWEISEFYVYKVIKTGYRIQES